MRREIALQAALIALAATVWVLLLRGDQYLATDFFPLHWGAREILAGRSPYGPAATARLAGVWEAPFVRAGVAYPAPMLLLVAPLAPLPFGAAALLWVLLGGAAAWLAVRLGEGWRGLLALPLLYMPVERGVAMGQASLLWLGLAALLALAVRGRRGWAVGVLAAVLLLKPQSGACFALAGLVWAAREDRRALAWFAGVSAAAWGGALLAQPGWAGAWLAQVQVYQRVVQPPGLLPAGLLLAAALWRQPWWARAAALQVVLFPLSDLYAALPLLLCWVAVGGQLALAGAAASWLWVALQLPNSLDVFWALLVLPLGLAGAWRGWAQPWLASRRRSPRPERRGESDGGGAAGKRHADAGVAPRGVLGRHPPDAQDT